MGGNYGKSVYNQLMDVMVRLEAMEAECKSGRKEIAGLNAEVKSPRKENSRLKTELGRQEPSLAIRGAIYPKQMLGRKYRKGTLDTG